MFGFFFFFCFHLIGFSVSFFFTRALYCVLWCMKLLRIWIVYTFIDSHLAVTVKGRALFFHRNCCFIDICPNSTKSIKQNNIQLSFECHHCFCLSQSDRCRYSQTITKIKDKNKNKNENNNIIIAKANMRRRDREN